MNSYMWSDDSVNAEATPRARVASAAKTQINERAANEVAQRDAMKSAQSENNALANAMATNAT
jgi:hypothetical protein